MEDPGGFRAATGYRITTGAAGADDSAAVAETAELEPPPIEAGAVIAAGVVAGIMRIGPNVWIGNGAVVAQLRN